MTTVALQRTPWQVRTMRAWSCDIRLAVLEPANADAAANDLAELLQGVDRVASRFRSDSALSIANRNAGRPTPIPRALIDLIDAALAAAAQTEGLVDPTVGSCLIATGYDRDIAALPADGPAVDFAPPPANWRSVRLDREAGLLTVPVGCRLDLGATAKAFTADRAAASLAARYGTGVLVELGGDVAVAGSEAVAARDPREVGWPIRVAERRDGPGQDVIIYGGAVTTSTTVIRRWHRGGEQMHHVIDPRTGAPAVGPWRTITVAAPCALAANTASTAALILGERAEGWLSARKLAARLVTQSGRVRAVNGWPEDRDDLREVA